MLRLNLTYLVARLIVMQSHQVATTWQSCLSILLHGYGRFCLKRAFAFAISFLSVVTLLASANEAPGANKRIGVLYWSMSIPGQVAMRRGLESEAERINREALDSDAPGVELINRVAGDGEQGMERQIKQFFDMIRQRPDAIIVQPTDNAALARPLREANRLGIPVVAYDQYISGGRLTAYVTSDNRQAGYLGGEYLADLFPDSHQVNLILVEYPHVSSTVERLNGFLDALRDYQQPYRILATYKAVELEAGHRAGKQILHDFPQPGSVDAVFTVNDGGGLGVVDELAAAGRDEIVVATIDGDPESIQNIRRQRLTRIDTAQFCGVLGATALQRTYDLLIGQPVVRRTLVPVFPVTRETLRLYPGWEGGVPQPFRKPWKAAEPVWTGELREKP
jgi:ribose transport system substrate-binding protein